MHLLWSHLTCCCYCRQSEKILYWKCHPRMTSYRGVKTEIETRTKVLQTGCYFWKSKFQKQYSRQSECLWNIKNPSKRVGWAEILNKASRYHKQSIPTRNTSKRLVFGWHLALLKWKQHTDSTGPWGLLQKRLVRWQNPILCERLSRV